jgi:hypothetical protein
MDSALNLPFAEWTEIVVLENSNLSEIIRFTEVLTG